MPKEPEHTETVAALEAEAAKWADCLTVAQERRPAFIEHYLKLFKRPHAYHVVSQPEENVQFSHAFILFPVLDERNNRRCHLLYERKDGSLFYGVMTAKAPSQFNQLNARYISAWKPMRGRMRGGAMEEDDVLSPDSIMLTEFANEIARSVLGGLCHYKTHKLSSSRRGELEKSLQAGLEETYKRLTYAVLRRFIANLNSANINLVDKSGDYSVGYYNFLNANGDQQRSTRRQQACEIYPLFSHYFQCRSMQTAIDEAKSLVSAISKECKLLPAVVRLFAGVSTNTLGVVSRRVKTPALFYVLRDMPHTGYPKSPADWVAIQKMAEPLLYLCNGQNLYHQSTRWYEHYPLSKCLHPFRHGWALGLGRLSDHIPGDLAQNVTSARDMLLEFGQRFAAEGNGTMAALYKMSLLEFLRASERWHREIPMIHAAAAAQEQTSEDAGAQSKREWPSLLMQRQVAFDAFNIIELTSRTSLAEEGSSMRHCVGNYVDRCKYSGTRIFSVRDSDGTSLSTFELRIDESGLLSLGQHGSRGNSSPEPAVVVAVDRFVRALQSEKIKHHAADVARTAIAKAAKLGLADRYIEQAMRTFFFQNIPGLLHVSRRDRACDHCDY